MIPVNIDFDGNNLMDLKTAFAFLVLSFERRNKVLSRTSIG